MMTFEQFEARLQRSLTMIRPQLEIGLDKVGELAETMAAAYVGHPQDGWRELAESTIKDKAAKGFPTPAPLLRTGQMRDSVKRELHPLELAVVVGSANPKALWQEMGTSRGIPPRPFLALGMRNALPFAADVFGGIAVKLLTGKT